MDSANDIEMEATTTFGPPPVPTYRFVFIHRNDKLSLWMEEPVSKMQWYSGDLAQSDIVVPSNTIPGAQLRDYIGLFCKLLEGELNKSGDVQRYLRTQAGEAFQLGLRYQIDPHFPTWVAVYEFNLYPATVERVYALEAQVRDLRGQLKCLREEFRFQQSEFGVVAVKALETNDNSDVVWKGLESADFAVAERSNALIIRRADVYMIWGFVRAPHDDFNQRVRLVKNGRKTRSVDTGISQHVTLLTAQTLMEKGDKLGVKCDCDIQIFPSLYVSGMSTWMAMQ